MRGWGRCEGLVEVSEEVFSTNGTQLFVRALVCTGSGDTWRSIGMATPTRRANRGIPARLSVHHIPVPGKWMAVTECGGRDRARRLFTIPIGAPADSGAPA